MEEIKLNMENLSSEEREQLMKLVEKANKNKPNMPKEGEEYYAIQSGGNIQRLLWRNTKYDRDVYSIGNYFTTKEDAEFALEKHKVVVELKRFAEEHNDYVYKDDYFHDIVYDEGRICARCSFRCCGPIWFTSNLIAWQAINAIGADRLKKYYFEVKE